MAAQNLWPTPAVTGNQNRPAEGTKRGTGLAEAGSPLWPTPTARLGDPKRGMPSSEHAAQRWESGRRNLDDAVRLWPTPTASMGEHGGLVTPAKARERGTLVEAVSARIFPTPMARDSQRGAATAETMQRRALKTNTGPTLSDHLGGPLNPDWVEWLMGFPIGWTDLER